MKLINYPAMASPKSMQFISDNLEKKLEPSSRVIDPYCGTGRLLFGSRNIGHNVIGIDCSPLAILTARVGYQGNNLKKIQQEYKDLVATFYALDLEFEGDDNELFWFPNKAYSDLRRLLLLIDEICSSSNSRRFFWLALSQTARVASYIREEEYKNHRMKEEKRLHFNPNVFDLFCAEFLVLTKRISQKSKEKGGNYRFIRGDVGIYKNLGNFDALITSPPYGDSISTVGYGQFARVPLLILSFSELFKNEFNLDLNKASIDTYCLGGGNCKTSENVDFPEQVNYIESGPMKKFCKDYFYRLKRLSDILKPKSYCAFVLADRTYKKRQFPLIESTITFMRAMGFELLAKEDRYLAWKRLPRSMQLQSRGRASAHQGMNYESVVVMGRKIGRTR